MLKGLFLVGIFFATLLPGETMATEESELVRLYYINKTPWTIKILIDGKYAIETTWGNELRPGESLQRFAKPGWHAFEAVALEHKYLADWITAKALFYYYPTEDDVYNDLEIEFGKEDFVNIRGLDFVKTNSATLLNFAVFAAIVLITTVIFIWGAYALLIKKSPS